MLPRLPATTHLEAPHLRVSFYHRSPSRFFHTGLVSGLTGPHLDLVLELTPRCWVG